MSLKRVVDAVEIVALAAVAIFVFMLFFNEPDDGAPEPAATGDAPAAVDGAALYDRNCSSCHGDDGTGGFAPQLGGGAAAETFPDAADQVAVVTSGRGGMPAFGDRLSAEEIAAIVEFTREGL